MPEVSVAPATVEEGGRMLFQVVLDRPPGSEETFRYQYVVRPDTAHEGEDFEAAEGELVFAPDRNTQPVYVVTRPDADDAGERTLLLAVLSGDREFTAQGTITDRPPDPAPRWDVEDATATENEPLRFRVSIDRPAAPGTSYRYSYSVTPGTAREGVDYRVEAGERSFGPGETEQWIEVTTLPDGAVDGERTLTLVVLVEGNEEAQANGTIRDADVASGDGPEQGWTLQDWVVLGGVALAALVLGAALVAVRRYWKDGGEEPVPVPEEQPVPVAAAPLPEAHCALLDGDPPTVEGESLPFAAPVMEIDVGTEPGAVEPPGPLPILEQEPSDEPAS